MTKRWSIRFVVGSLKQLSSNIHAYDVALCHFQDAFHRFSSQYPHRDRCITSAWAYPSSAVFESCLRTKTVSDQHVWDIVARWHGLRQLQHLYLIPAIRSKYVGSFCPTRDTVPQEADPLDIAVRFGSLAQRMRFLLEEPVAELKPARRPRTAVVRLISNRLGEYPHAEVI